MMKIKFTLILIIFGFFLASCASNRFQVEQPVKVPFNTFDALQIASIRSNVKTKNVDKMVDSLPDIIIGKINKYNDANSGNPIFKVVTKGKSNTSNPLKANCVITSYEEGSRAKRYFVGFGSGKAYSSLNCLFLNAENKTVAEADFDGELAMGFFGGGAEESYHAMANSIVEYIVMNY